MLKLQKCEFINHQENSTKYCSQKTRKWLFWIRIKRIAPVRRCSQKPIWAHKFFQSGAYRHLTPEERLKIQIPKKLEFINRSSVLARVCTSTKNVSALEAHSNSQPSKVWKIKMVQSYRTRKFLIFQQSPKPKICLFKNNLNRKTVENPLWLKS